MKRGGENLSSAYSYKEQIHEKQAFHIIILLLLLATLAVSTIALLNTNELKKSLLPLLPQTVNTNDFLKKLTAHEEMKSHIGTAPLNVVQINSNNIANLQSQIAGLDTSYLGSFIVQYSDAIVIYDYQNDAVKGTVNLQQQQPLPSDLFAKLYAHPEASGLQSQQPAGGQLDASSLATLMQQFPDVYANAKAGDFLLRYQSKLIIYDYNADRIVNAVNLQ